MSALIVMALHDASMNAAGTPTLSGSTGVMALVAANLYGFCFGFSWGLVVWVMLAWIIHESAKRCKEESLKRFRIKLSETLSALILP